MKRREFDEKELLEEKKMLDYMWRAMGAATDDDDFEKSIKLWKKYSVIKLKLCGEGADWFAQDRIKEYSELLQESDNDPKKVRDEMIRRINETPQYDMSSGAPYY